MPLVLAAGIVYSDVHIMCDIPGKDAEEEAEELGEETVVCAVALRARHLFQEFQLFFVTQGPYLQRVKER